MRLTTNQLSGPACVKRASDVRHARRSCVMISPVTPTTHIMHTT